MSKAPTPRRFAQNEAAATVRNLRTSPRKLNLVAQFIRGMKAGDAITQLTFLNKKVAKDVKKLVQSAVANAENNHGLDIDSLYVSEATVGKAFEMRRFHSRARGRMGRICKPFSHMTVVLREKEE
jgi:large subunit ribosomal protein L22